MFFALQRRKKKWPPSEKLLMLSALKRHGTQNVEAISREMIYHSKEDIEEFIAKEKRMQVNNKCSFYLKNNMNF